MNSNSKNCLDTTMNNDEKNIVKNNDWLHWIGNVFILPSFILTSHECIDNTK